MMQKPSVSIIIPCKDVDDYTVECIEGCLRLDYPHFEIILLPDSPVKRSINFAAIIPTGPVSPGQKRNIGVENSHGEFCAFIDNDAYPRSDWLTNSIDLLREPAIGGVGGPGLTPPEDGSRQKAGGYVLSSFMVGGLSSRYKQKSCVESDDIHSCNFVTRKTVIKEAGGWSEKYWPGEDTLMCLAIKKIGKKLIESSNIVVYHHRRSLFKAHLKQVSRFGEHRGFFVKRFPENSGRLTYFIPTLLILALFSGFLLSLIYPVFTYVLSVGLATYLVCGLIGAALQVNEGRLILLVWSGIIVTHLVYGLYFLFGLIKRDLKR